MLTLVSLLSLTGCAQHIISRAIDCQDRTMVSDGVNTFNVDYSDKISHHEYTECRAQLYPGVDGTEVTEGAQEVRFSGFVGFRVSSERDVSIDVALNPVRRRRVRVLQYDNYGSSTLLSAQNIFNDAADVTLESDTQTFSMVSDCCELTIEASSELGMQMEALIEPYTYLTVEETGSSVGKTQKLKLTPWTDTGFRSLILREDTFTETMTARPTAQFQHLELRLPLGSLELILPEGSYNFDVTGPELSLPSGVSHSDSAAATIVLELGGELSVALED